MRNGCLRKSLLRENNHRQKAIQLKSVLHSGLCVGCGACEIVDGSPLQVRMNEFGRFEALGDLDSADECLLKVLDEVCPMTGAGPTLDEMSREEFPHCAQYDDVLGRSLACYVGHVAVAPFRDIGASGGIVSWLCCALLKAGLVDSIVHVGSAKVRDTGVPLYEFRISRSEQEVLDGASTRYYPVEMSSVLASVRAARGRYAVVGVPCFVKAVRLLCRRQESLRRRIRFCIGLVCGHLKSARFADFLACQCNIRPDDLLAVNFRKKLTGRPANKYGIEFVYRANGKTCSFVRPMEGLLGADWGHGFFKYKACDYCEDIFAETADVTMGDAWLPDYVNDAGGSNVVVVRHQDIHEVLEAGREHGELHLATIAPEVVRQSQNANVRHRRRGLAYRLWLDDRRGQWHPKLRVRPSNTGFRWRDKAILKLRVRLRDKSSEVHPFKSKGDLEVFVKSVERLLNRYRRLYQSRGCSIVKYCAQETADLLKRAAFATCHALIRGLAFIRGRCGVAILPPSSPGSLGDEAVLNGFLKELRRRTDEPICLLSYRRMGCWNHVDGQFSVCHVGDFIQNRTLLSWIRVALTLSKCRRLYVLGTDVLDGYYSVQKSVGRIRLAQCASSLGIATAVVGFSYSKNPELAAKKAFQSLSGDVHVCSRDTFSKKNAEFFLGRTVELTADPAFLLDPAVVSAEMQQTVDWLAKRRAEQSTVFGINANHLLLNAEEGITPEKVSESIADTIVHLASENTRLVFCLIPHDVRGNPSDVDLARMAFAMIPPTLQERVMTVPFPCRAAEIKALAKNIDCVLSGKMHLAIACLGESVPVGCVTYKDHKFAGLFQHFGLESVTMSPREYFDPVRRLDFVSSLLARRHELRETIHSNLARVRIMARRNVGVLFSDVDGVPHQPG